MDQKTNQNQLCYMFYIKSIATFFFFLTTKMHSYLYKYEKRTYNISVSSHVTHKTFQKITYRCFCLLQTTMTLSQATGCASSVFYVIVLFSKHTLSLSSLVLTYRDPVETFFFELSYMVLQGEHTYFSHTSINCQPQHQMFFWFTNNNFFLLFFSHQQMKKSFEEKIFMSPSFSTHWQYFSCNEQHYLAHYFGKICLKVTILIPCSHCRPFWCCKVIFFQRKATKTTKITCNSNVKIEFSHVIYCPSFVLISKAILLTLLATNNHSDFITFDKAQATTK